MLCRFGHGLHAFGMESLGRVARDQFNVDALAGLCLQALCQGLDLIGHGIHARIGGVAQVDAELDPPRDDIAAVGVHLHHAHRAAPVRRELLGRHHLDASGGGGGVFSGSGGTGGTNAGNGGSYNTVDATSAVANTGSGGGGGGGTLSGNFYASFAGAGGSGVVILSYPSTYTITIGAGLTGTTATVSASKVTTLTAGTGNVSWS